jgi:hypothetical protein
MERVCGYIFEYIASGVRSFNSKGKSMGKHIVFRTASAGACKAVSRSRQRHVHHFVAFAGNVALVTPDDLGMLAAHIVDKRKQPAVVKMGLLLDRAMSYNVLHMQTRVGLCNPKKLIERGIAQFNVFAASHGRDVIKPSDSLCEFSLTKTQCDRSRFAAVAREGNGCSGIQTKIVWVRDIAGSESEAPAKQGNLVAQRLHGVGNTSTRAWTPQVETLESRLIAAQDENRALRDEVCALRAANTRMKMSM